MPDVIQIQGNVVLNTRPAEAALRRLEAAGKRVNVSPFGRLATSTQSFESSLARATNRVVAFAAAAQLFNAFQRTVQSLVSSTIQVEQSLARINVNLGKGADGLKEFSSGLFNVARQTGAAFNDAAKAAEELARQGLTAEETLKRLKDALTLSRIAGIDSVDAVETLTAAYNTFRAEALSTTEILNKLAAVDTRFAVSSKDLADAIARVGSTAQDAGVQFDELLAIVTSVQQTTQRGGAVIGNAFKTIFTRIQNPETLDQLEAIGVAVRDLEGNTLPAIKVLRNLADVYGTLSQAQQTVISKEVAGTYQINVLKAALSDLSKTQSEYNRALNTSANATDEAIQKNAQLNKTLQSSITATANTVKQLFSSIGEQDIGPVTKTILDGIESVRATLSGDTGSELGKDLGNGILKGLVNVLSGPALIAVGLIVGGALKKVFSTIGEDVRGLVGLNNLGAKRAEVQTRINALLSRGTQEEINQYNAARSTLQAKEAILAISQRLTQMELIGTPLQNSFLSKSGAGGALGKINVSKNLRVPSFANMSRGAAGVPNYASADRYARGEFLGEGQLATVNRGVGRLKNTVFKRFFRGDADMIGGLKYEYETNKELEAEGLPVAKVIGSLARSRKRGGIAKEYIGGFGGDKLFDKLKGDDYDSFIKSFGDIFRKKGFEPKDIDYANIKVRDDLDDILGVYNKGGYGSIANRLLSNAVAIDTGAVMKKGVLSFADPVQSAIAREKASGLRMDQIYVDKDPRVAGPGNPQGILVANTRDEPLGGRQGVDRVLRQGGNPKVAGITPNFATFGPGELTGPPQQSRKYALTGASEPIIDPEAERTVRKAIRDINSLFGELAKAPPLGDKFNKIGARIQGLASVLDKVSQDKVVTKVAEQFSKAKDNLEGVIRDSQSYTKPIGPQRPLLPDDVFKRSLYGPKTREPEPPELSDLKQSQFPDDAEARKFIAASRKAAEMRKASSQPLGPAFPINPDLLARLQKRDQEIRYARADIVETPDAYDAPIGPPTQRDARRQRLAAAVGRGAASRRQSLAARAQRRETINKATFGLAFVAPFAAGFIPEGTSGRTSGIAAGASQGALQGAGTGGIVGPGGAAIGAVIGAVIGGFARATKSIEELSKGIDESRAKRTAELDAIQQTVRLQDEYNEALERGASSDVLKRLQDQLSSSRLQVRSSGGANIINAATPEARAAALAAQEGVGNRQTALEDLTLRAAASSDRGIIGQLSKASDRTAAKLDKVLGPFGKVAGVITGTSFVNAGLKNVAGLSEPSDNDVAKAARAAVPAFSEALKGATASQLKSLARSDLVGGLAKTGDQVTDDDVSLLGSTLRDFGIDIKVTRENFRVLNRGLFTAAQNVRQEQNPANRAQTAQPATRNLTAFIGADLGGDAAFRSFGAPRGPGSGSRRGNRLARDQGFLSAIGRLEDLKAFGEGGFGKTDETKGAIGLFKQTQARVARQGAYSTASDVLGGIQRFKGIPLTLPNGDPNAKLITSLLNQLAKSSDEQEAILGKILLASTKTADANTAALGANKKAPAVEGGLVEGVKYSTYSGGSAPGKGTIKVNPYGVTNDYEETFAAKMRAQKYIDAHTIIGGKGAVTSVRSSEAALGRPGNVRAAADQGFTDEEDADYAPNGIQDATKLLAEAREIADKTAAALANTTVDVNVKVNGFIENLQDNVLFQDTIGALIQRLSRVEGKPLPPGAAGRADFNPLAVGASSKILGR